MKDKLAELTHDGREYWDTWAALAWTDPAQARRLAEMRAELDGWMKQTGDQGLATERALPDPRKPAETRPSPAVPAPR